MPLAAALIGMLLAIPSAWTGRQGDDYWHQAALMIPEGLDSYFHGSSSLFCFADGNPERTMRLVNFGLLPWWTALDFKLWFYRPLSGLIHVLDYTLWPEKPVLMHLHSIAWYGLWVYCISVLYRLLLPGRALAGLATILFAVDYAHSLHAGWVASRNSLLAGLMGTLCLLLHHAWRSNRGGHHLLLALLALGLALASKESAVGALGFIISYAATLERGTVLHRIVTVTPYAMLTLVWHVAYRFWGYGASGSGAYIDPYYTPFDFVGVLFVRVPVLLLGQLLFPPAELVWVLPPAAHLALWVTAVVVVFSVLFLAWPFLQHERMARFWLLGMLVATIPASLGILSSRQMEFAGIGASAFLALLISWLYANKENPCTSRLLLFMRIGLLHALVVTRLILSPLLFCKTHYYFSRPYILQYNSLNQQVMMSPDLYGKTVILLNPPHASYATYLLIHRALTGVAMPAHAWALAPAGVKDQEISWRRIDERTLQIDIEKGTSVWLERSSRNPLRSGDMITLDGMAVLIMETENNGNPTSLQFRLEQPLESDAYVWYFFSKGEVYPWTPPFK